jgi:signal transduction histidine kinase/response regulator RpfG family c-di-GMP phosphodiesterase
LAVVASLTAIAAFAFFRLYLYPDRAVPLTYALPLLLGVWHKNRTLHWTLTALLAIVAAGQVFWVFPPEVAARVSRPTSYAMMLANIGIVAVVVDWLIATQARLRGSYIDLESANGELEASNEELAAREEEISSQNEELQSQAEELEHQNEELQQQSEELQQQSEELQQLNDESAGRQEVLQTMLEASTTPPTQDGLEAAAERICEAALQATHEATGAMLLAQDDGDLVVLGRSGVELPAGVGASLQLYADPFVATVMHERRTAAIEDLRQTPEVTPPCDSSGAPFRAALVTPILDGPVAVGAIVLYAPAVRRWTEAEFQLAKWLSAQAGLVLLSARLQRELDHRREEAEDASQRKTRFLAAVSHDVRTPANAISLTAEVIKKAGEDPQYAHEIPEMAESLRANAKLLVELVSDVLDLARFDSGKVDVEASEFCLQDMVGREITQYQALARSAGLSLDGSTNSSPIWMRSDRMKLARVLSNLIGNAIKFTDRGRVEVQCTQADNGLVEIHVHDTGVGIQPTHLEHIFDEFFQIKNPERDRSKGTGLGLAICKRLVDAIGCALTVRSRFGEGTTFTIRIPQELVIAAPGTRDGVVQQQQQPQPALAAQRLAGRLVLLVEDHVSTRAAFSRLLTAQGATVETAGDGREALRVLAHHAPDVVLLDLMLPDMDGREVLRRLAKDRPANLRCVLAVSGDVTEERRREVESLGADGLAAKPLQIGELVERVCTILAAPAECHSHPAIDRRVRDPLIPRSRP